MHTIIPSDLAAELITAAPPLTERAQHLAISLYRVLAQAEPVEPAELADRAEITREEVDRALAEWGVLFIDDEGRVTGFLGLSIRPMPHRLTVNGRTLYAWCAYDTLFLPELLGAAAEVESRCPTTRERITLTVNGTQVTNRQPAETVLSYLHRHEPLDQNVINSFCHYIHFFTNPDAAEHWTSQHEGTFTLSLAEASEIARLTNRGRYPDADKSRHRLRTRKRGLLRPGNKHLLAHNERPAPRGSASDASGLCDGEPSSDESCLLQRSVGAGTRDIGVDMSKLRPSITMSLDGYVAGPDQSEENPLGVGGMELHQWFFPLKEFREMHGEEGGEVNASSAVVEERRANIGATIMGRNMFGPVRGPWPDESWRGWWGEDPPYHHPVFVLTHHPREPLEMEGDTTFYFVSDGIESALAQAKDAAGGRDVWLAGGASVINQYLASRLVDEIDISVAPVILGAGARLFDGVEHGVVQLKQLQAIDAPGVTHIKYEVI